MKIFASIIILASALSVQALAEAPKVSVEEAVKIASGFLREQGYDKAHYISSISLEPTTLTRSKFNWIVTWTPSIPSKDRQETGLQISMDGSVVRLVTRTTRESVQELDRKSVRFMR